MPDIDDFIRPKEWVSDFTSDLGKVLRRWGEERYMPIRQEVDEDWQEHKLIEPMLKEVLVDLGINAAFFPYEVGGTDMPDPMSLTAVVCEELARIDSGFATACICSIWGIIPAMLKPHRNMELMDEFGVPHDLGHIALKGEHAAHHALDEILFALYHGFEIFIGTDDEEAGLQIAGVFQKLRISALPCFRAQIHVFGLLQAAAGSQLEHEIALEVHAPVLAGFSHGGVVVKRVLPGFAPLLRGIQGHHIPPLK